MHREMPMTREQCTLVIALALKRISCAEFVARSGLGPRGAPGFGLLLLREAIASGDPGWSIRSHGEGMTQLHANGRLVPAARPRRRMTSMSHDGWNRMRRGVLLAVAVLALGACAAARGPSSDEAAHAFELRDDVWRSLGEVAPLEPTRHLEISAGFHSRHAGEIVFTRKDLDSDATLLADADLRRAFELGDRISLRAFLREPIERSMRRAGVTCHTDASISLESALPTPGPARWLTAPISFTATRWTPSTPLYGTRALVPANAPHVDDPMRLPYFASAALSALKEGRHAFGLVLRAVCYGDRDGGEGTYGVIVARGSFDLLVAQGALARYREAFGPTLPPTLHPEILPLVTGILSRSRRAPFAIALPTDWHLSGGEHRTALRRETTVLAIRQGQDGHCEIVRGGLSQRGDAPLSARWLEDTTEVWLDERENENVRCDLVKPAIQ
jgi:hypothetical protein